MEEYQVKLLFNFDALTDSETGFEAKHVMDHLWQDRAVSDDQRQEIRAERTTRKQAGRLIDYLVETGEEACRSLYNALKETYPHFAELLDNTPEDARDRFNSGSREVMGNKGSNLPALSIEFVGRDDCRQRFLSWLRTNDTSKRLYVFTGCPGIGKTSLMIKTLQEHEVSSTQSEASTVIGIIFFDLSCVPDVGSVANGLIHILDPPKNESFLTSRNTEEGRLVRQLCDYFRECGRRFVLAFDNAEDGMTDSFKDTFLCFIETVLQSSPNVRIAMASRVSVTCRSIALVEENLQPLEEDESSMLCSKLLPGVDTDTCTRLAKITGGLPLAIMLMAVQMQGKKRMEDVISALEQSPKETLSLLDATQGTQHTALLSHCFESVFSRLTNEQKSSLISCSVFPYSFDREAARYIIMYKERPETNAVVQTYSVLKGLEAMSMLTFDKKNENYHIHPLLRTFCHNKRSDGERRQAEYRFCEYFVNLIIMQIKHKTRKNGVPWNLIYAFQRCHRDTELSRPFLPMASVLGLSVATLFPVPTLFPVFTSLLHSLRPEEKKERIAVLSMLALLPDERTSHSALEYTQKAGKLLADTDICDLNVSIFIMVSEAIVYSHHYEFDKAESTLVKLLELWESEAKAPSADTRVLLQLTCVQMLFICIVLFKIRPTLLSIQLINKAIKQKVRLYMDPKFIDEFLIPGGFMS